MQLAPKIKHALGVMRGHFMKRNILITAAALVSLVFVVAYWPRTISFSYAGESCIGHVSVLPQLLESSDDATYVLEQRGEVRIGSYPLLATKVCVDIVSAPKEGTVRMQLSPFGWLPLGKLFSVVTPPAPRVSVAPFEKPLPATRPVRLSLSESDTVFTYLLSRGEKQERCAAQLKAVSCDLAGLELEQGQSHELVLQREVRDQVETIATKEVSILPAVVIEEATVTTDQVVYDKPREFSFTANKEIISSRAVLHRLTEEGEHAHEVDTINEGAAIRATLKEELQRESRYRLTLANVEAVDGSTLAEDTYQVEFVVSGGPKVATVNIGTHSVDSGSLVLIRFDQPLLAGQDVAQYIVVKGVPAVISQRDERTVGVQIGAADRCAAFTIQLKKGIKSEYEVESTTEWSHNSRIRCATSEVIGYSVQGRPIIAYTYGNGGANYLFTGAIHGNEISSRITMHAWMSDLEANHHKIPAGARVTVVPEVSPDGVARRDRLNANQVNLNRNFPTSNWMSDIITGSGEQAGGGGPSAGSEPETKALMSLTRRIAPRLVVTHHSLGSLVNSNDVGIAISAGQDYARLARYRFIPNSATTATFGFEMTGTYEDWLLERGTPAILIELDTHTGNHYARNQAALWAMIGK